MSATAPHATPTTENCRFCWMCRQVCPVGHVTSRETLTPHAWALTIESVTRGQLAWNAETAGVMYACADCGLCQAHCVTDQPLPDAIAAARSDIVRAGVAPAIVADLDAKLRAHANLYSTDSPRATSHTGPVALFVGDVAHHRHRPSVDAAIRLLAAAGRDVVVIGDGRSNGMLASSLGLRSTAETLAQAVTAEIQASGASEVLVLTPGDRWTFEYVYPTRLGLTWPAQVAVREVTDVLAEALTAGRLSLRPRATAPIYAYHDPCHSVRVARDGAAPRALLASILGEEDETRELFWRTDRAHPCGASGGLEFTSPAIASALAASRMKDASAAGAQVLVTEDPGCLTHLAAHRLPNIDVVSLYELLADQLHL